MNSVKEVTKRKKFDTWWGHKDHHGRDQVWQYFHREFPREAVESIFDKSFGNYCLDSADDTTKVMNGALDALERLWNGGEVVSNLLIPAGMICDTCGQLECICTKPICPTCEGSREKCTLLSDPHNPHPNCDMQPCPDCKEQFTFLRQDGLKYPNERKGEERRVNSKHAKRRMKTWGYINAILVDKSYSVADCGDENYQVVDKIIQVIAADTGEPLASRDDVPLYMPDNRKKDRRKSQ